MSLAEISTPPHDADSLASWSFAHMAAHRDINRRIFETKNQSLPLFALDPIDPANTEAWLLQHAEMHNAQNQALNIQGYNLLSLDWQDQDSVLSWITQNYDEHQRACQILGIA